MKMKEVREIINQIANTSSRNDKEAILNRNKDNQLFKDILDFVYNPYIITGLSSAKINKKIREVSTVQLNDIYDFMNYLKKNNTGTDKVIKNVQEFIYSQDKNIQELLLQIATKSLKIGITDKTINKIFGKNFIPAFDVMLAKKYFDCEDKVKGNFVISQKLDGLRCAILKENGLITIMSRQGKIFDGLIEIEEDVKSLPDNMVYDGELLAINIDNLESKDLYRKTMNLATKKGNKIGLIHNCFDIIPINEFKQGQSKLNCISRKNQLHDIFANLNLEHIIEVPVLYIGDSKDKVTELLNDAISKGQEGVMVNLDKPYACKRTDNILKVKKMQDIDVKCIGFEEGDGKNKGTLGRINIDYKGNVVGVGSGFSDEMRKEIWNNQYKYIDKIVKVQYFEVTTNQKDDNLSLRFPVFLEWRFDKDEPSYY